MNEYDSSKMADLLDATHGYQLTEVAEKQMCCCSIPAQFIEKARKEFSINGRWKLLKKNPDLIIGVGGCVASRKATIFASARICRYYFRAANPAACRR
ncbi:hypothetical protein MJ561_09080 [Klebsiella pneumoniae]|nr:hypothetical protein MJ561_09080 [Klebsiella pneumoniae]